MASEHANPHARCQTICVPVSAPSPFPPHVPVSAPGVRCRCGCRRAQRHEPLLDGCEPELPDRLQGSADWGCLPSAEPATHLGQVSQTSRFHASTINASLHGGGCLIYQPTVSGGEGQGTANRLSRRGSGRLTPPGLEVRFLTDSRRPLTYGQVSREGEMIKVYGTSLWRSGSRWCLQFLARIRARESGR